MLEKTKMYALLLCLLSATLWLLPEVAAQVNTGTASGQIKLCSEDPITKVRTERAQSGVKVCAYWEDAWVDLKDKNRRHRCSKCKSPICETETTETDGFFTIPELNVGSWVFVAVKKNFTLKDGFARKEIAGHTNTVESEVPPLWLVPTTCSNLAENRPSFDPSFRTSVVASVSGQRGKFADIAFVLYQNEQKKNEPATPTKEPITLKGKVVDTESQPLQEAEVFITAFGEDEDPDLSAFPDPIKTKKDGEFSFTLPARWEPGTYIFSVTLEGFRPSIMTLEQAIKKLGASPQPSAGSEASAQTENLVILSRREELHNRLETLVEKFEATRRYVFTPEVMQTLPVQGTRSFDQFALLAPGVLPPPETFGGVGPGVSAGVGTAGQFSVNGLRSRENNFTIDGSDNNDENIGTRRQGFIMTVPQPIESVQELQVITALGDARFGRNIGGQVNALTKTGGLGNFHGSLYAYVTDHHLNARDPFDQSAAGTPPAFTLRRASDGAPVLLDGAPLVRQNPVGGKDQFRRAQLGLTAGGQLTRDNDTSYFVSVERQDLRASKEAYFAVPTVGQRGAFESGDTGLVLTTKPSIRTTLFPASVPGNAIFSLYPFPNNPRGPYGENTYSTVLPADGHGTRFSVKLDRQFSGGQPECESKSDSKTKGGQPEPKPNSAGCRSWFKNLFSLNAHIDQITGRYNFTDELSTLPVTGGALFSALRPKVRTQNLAFFVNRSLSGSTSDTIRFSFGRTRLSFDERRDASLLPSSALPGTRFLLNAPLLLNITRPNDDGTLNAPSFVSAAGPQGTAVLNSLGYSAVTQTEQITGPLGQVFIAGFSPLGADVENFPQERANITYQIADTVTSVKDKHLFTFGVDMRNTRINSTLDRNFRPRAVFHGLPGAPFADILERPGGTQVQSGTLTGATLAAAGVPTGLFQALATVPDSFVGIRFSQVNLFFQDQWRLSSRFHLTAGVRYELNTVPDTVGRRLETALDPVELRTLAEQARNFCNSPRCDDLVGAVAAAFPADFTVSYGSDRNDFDARLGFAWTPSRLRNTSIRGGFGTYSGQFPGIVIDQARNAFPDFMPLNIANFTPRSGNQTFLFNLANPAVQQLIPGPPIVTPGTLNNFPTINPLAFLVNQVFNLQDLSLTPTAIGLDLVLPQRELKSPFALHYGLTVERQFGKDYLVSVAYVGTSGDKLLRVSTPDFGLNDSRFSGSVSVNQLTDAAPFPFFQGAIRPPQTNLISQSFAIARTFFESNSHSSYNSLQIEFRKRYADAFLIGSAFTYSHSIDDASDFFDNAGAFALPQNSLRRDERASSNFDVRVRSATHFVLDIQEEWFSKGEWKKDEKKGKKDEKKVWLGRVLGGFQLAGIFTAQGGQPYTINSALDINRDGNLTDRLNTTAGIIREPGRVQLRLAPGVITRDLLAADGQDGAVGRNTFRAPALYSFDFAVTYALPAFRDRNRFVVRTEFFNLFNWSNYGIPVRTLESPGFGASVSTRSPPRTIQVVGKFQF